MIHELKLTNFTVFRDVAFSFGQKLNVLVGGNGSGKTHLLKALYAMVNTMRRESQDGKRVFNHSTHNPNSELLADFRSVFNVSEDGDLLNWKAIPKEQKITGTVAELSSASFVKNQYLSNLAASLKLKMGRGQEVNDYAIQFTDKTAQADNGFDKVRKGFHAEEVFPPCVFFPCRELLTIFPHYLALRREYPLPYDSTYDDTIGKLGLPPRNGKGTLVKSVIFELEEAIQGTILLENERFYYHENEVPAGLDWRIDMIAEGWRKIGMLLQLLQNGSLRENSILFWDEPEANLNPSLICLIAKVIVALSKLGIQVFIATHSLFFVNELEIVLAQEKMKDGVRFFNLERDKEPQQGDTLSDLKNVMILDEDMKQSDRYLAEEI